MHPYLFPWTIPAAGLTALAYVGVVLVAAALSWFFAGRGGWKANPVQSVLIFAVAAAVGVMVVSTRLEGIEAQPLPIHTYGLMIALGFISAIHLGGRAAERFATIDGHAFFRPDAPALGAAAREAQTKREAVGPIVGRKAREHVFDIGFWVLVGAVIGARALFIIVNWGGPDGYGANPQRIFMVWTGGLVFYGGFIGATIAAFVYCRRHGVDFRALADIGAPLVALGHFFGRLGCMSAGCCWGKVCEDPAFVLGARFPEGSLAYSDMVSNSEFRSYILEHGHTPPLHPTQLYEGLGELGLFLFLTYWATRKRFRGQLLAMWLMLYALLRLSIETFRGDFGRGMLLRWPEADPVLLSTSQTVGICLFIVGAVFFFAWKPRKEGSSEEGAGASAAAA